MQVFDLGSRNRLIINPRPLKRGLFVAIKNIARYNSSIMVSMDTHSFFEQEIITRFRLFQDRRPREEDEKILSLVSDEVWGEALRFLEELIPFEEQGLVQAALEENPSEETMLMIFKKYVDGEVTAWRLRTRLNTFLDNLLIQSFTKL